MKNIKLILLSVIVSIMLTGCSNPFSKEDSNKVTDEITITGTLVSKLPGTDQVVEKKEIMNYPYWMLGIQDDFGTTYDIKFRTALMNEGDAIVTDAQIEELFIDSTLTVTAYHNVVTAEGITAESYDGISFTVDHIPLELITGLTSYDLMNQVHDWHYKEIHTEVTMEGTMTSEGRTMPYAYSDMITKENDGNTFHSVQTLSETVDLVQQNQSIVIYSDLVNDKSYLNINYEQWDKLDDNVIIDTNVDITQSELDYHETAYYLESGRYIIEGEMLSLDSGFVGNLIKDALADYAYFPEKLHYTFRAVIDEATQQLIFTDYDITYDDILMSDYDTLTLTKFNILVSNIAYNNTDTVLLPDYIGESIYERNRPKFLCEAWFGISPAKVTASWIEDTFTLPEDTEHDSDDELLEDLEGTTESEEGLQDSEEGVQESEKVERQAVIECYIRVLTTYTTETVKDFLAKDEYESPEEEYIVDIIRGFADIYGDYESDDSEDITDDTDTDEDEDIDEETDDETVEDGNN